MDLQLTGSVVLITGASGGIGRALASAFAAEGARLALTGNEHVDDLRAWMQAERFPDAIALEADTRDPISIDAAFDATRKKFGRVDVAIANAGKWTPDFALLHTASVERIRDNVTTNLLGSMWTARAFLRTLATTGPRDDGRGASLALIGSTAGRFGEKGHAEYAASKAGLFGLVQTLKNEIVDLDPFARVNLIEPGWTVTHMARPALREAGVIERVVRTMPLRQLGRAQDVARTALYLSSPAMSRHVSGQIVTVAGGMEGRTLWNSDQIDEDAIRRRTDDP